MVGNGPARPASKPVARADVRLFNADAHTQGRLVHGACAASVLTSNKKWGPYLYARWRSNGRKRSKYIGKSDLGDGANTWEAAGCP